MRPPSVDRLARSLADTGLPHPLLVDVAREAIATGDPDRASELAELAKRRLITPVVNATGVLLHTNLGRAPVGIDLAERYDTLEFDMETGGRGSRHRHAAALAAKAVGAEAALVVNNCAGTVVLALAALAQGRGAVVSRGELVEIGGGFRIPEVMEASGARMIEVGTTNRTRLSDVEGAVEANDVAVVLQVHRSNYRIEGFTETPTIAELASIGPPVLADIGSGLLDAGCPWLEKGPPPWLADEPAARQTLQAGAALVMFSGDKLLGGPQAGIIAGDAELVERCARHPLARALRPGGMVLAALQDTLLHYLERDGDAIAFWRMASTPVTELEARAEALGVGQPARMDAVPGGGTLPGRTISSAGIRLDGDRSAELRAVSPVPIVARVQDGSTWLDLRTVDPSDDELIAAAVVG